MDFATELCDNYLTESMGQISQILTKKTPVGSTDRTSLWNALSLIRSVVRGAATILPWSHKQEEKRYDHVMLFIGVVWKES